MAVPLRVVAGDECIEAFKSMDEPHLNQLVEGAIDLQGCAEAVVTKLIKDYVGAHRSLGVQQVFEDKSLIACEL